MADNKKKWMQKVTKSPKFKKGALRAQAKREGALENGISEKWMQKKLSDPKTSQTTKRRIRLAMKFKAASKKRSAKARAAKPGKSGKK